MSWFMFESLGLIATFLFLLFGGGALSNPNSRTKFLFLAGALGLFVLSVVSILKCGDGPFDVLIMAAGAAFGVGEPACGGAVTLTDLLLSAGLALIGAGALWLLVRLIQLLSRGKFEWRAAGWMLIGAVATGAVATGTYYIIKPPSDLVARYETALAQIEELKATEDPDVRRLREEATEAARQVVRMTTDRDRLRAALTAAQETAAARQTRLTEIDSALQAAHAETARLTDQLRPSQIKADRMERLAQATQQELTATATALAAAQTQIADLTAQRRALTVERGALTRELETARATAADAQAALTALQERLAAAEEAQAQLRAALSAAESALTEAERQRAADATSAAADLAAAQSEITDLTTAQQTLTTERDRLAQELEVAKASVITAEEAQRQYWCQTDSGAQGVSFAQQCWPLDTTEIRGNDIPLSVRREITDASPLAGLTGLQTLYLSETQVSDLTPLSSLTGLQRLYLGNTQVSDLTPLSGLTGLHRLQTPDGNYSWETVQ